MGGITNMKNNRRNNNYESVKITLDEMFMYKHIPNMFVKPEMSYIRHNSKEIKVGVNTCGLTVGGSYIDLLNTRL